MSAYTSTIIADTMQETALRLRAMGLYCHFKKRDHVLHIQNFFIGIRFLLTEQDEKLFLRAGFLSGLHENGARSFKDITFRCSAPLDVVECCLMVVEKVRTMEEELRKTAVESY